MILLPSMLAAATVIGGCGNANIQTQLPNCQIITGDICDLETLLGNMGVDIDSIVGCLKPSIPDTELPDNTPDAELPDNETEEDKDQNTDMTYIQQVAALVNAERVKEGLSPLTISQDLNTAAQKRAEETVEKFSHTRPNGSSCFSVLDELGITYRCAGENIAFGQKTPEEVVTAWLNSKGHRDNILSEDFTMLGIGYYVSNGVTYWTQMFAC